MTSPRERAARRSLARTIAAELIAAGTTGDADIDERTYWLTDAELDVIGYESDRDLLPLQNGIRAVIDAAAGPQQCLDADPFARRADADLEADFNADWRAQLAERNDREMREGGWVPERYRGHDPDAL